MSYTSLVRIYKGWVIFILKNLVSIKGTKSGIILVLDSNESFDNLKNEIAEKFADASGFLGNNSMGLIIRGKDLSEDQENEVLDIISNNSNLRISCIINEASAAEKYIAEAIKRTTSDEISDNTVHVSDVASEVSNNDARVFVGNLRSGQDISCEQSIVVMGDVKPGANVVSYGSIFILGELRGNAFAGAGGDRNAIVLALKLNPLQVRIADAIAISPDAEKGPKLKFRKKKIMDDENQPEVAYIENGHIVKSVYGASFLRQFNK